MNENNVPGKSNTPRPGPLNRWHPKHLPWYMVAVIALVLGLVAGGFYINSDENSSIKNDNVSEEDKSQANTSLTSLETLQAQADPTEIQGRIAVIGCSNTRQHVEGYGKWSEKDTLWYQDVDTGGGSLATWAEISRGGKPYWAWFKAAYEEKGASAIWVQLCLREAETSPSGMTATQQQNLRSIITNARSIVGADAEVYVSPLNYYVEQKCAAVGTYGVSNAAELADWATETGLAYRGPDTGPLSSDMLIADNCHLNASGMDFVGQQMVSFFDNGSVVVVPPSPDPVPIPDPDPGQTPTPDPGPNPKPNPNPDPSSEGKPTVSFAYTPNPVAAGQKVYFLDQTMDNGYILKWRWIIEDGTVLYEQNPTHTFQQSGTYKVRLQVVDNEGYRVTKTQTITVQ